MRATILGVLGLVSLAAAPPAMAGSFEDDGLAELNFARAHPQRYAREISRHDAAYARDDDPAAAEEAVEFLLRQPPMPPLRRDGQVALAASAHVDAQGPRGGVGHGPPGGLGRGIL